MRPTLPPLSSLNLPTLPLSGMSDRRSSSPGSDSDDAKSVSYIYPTTGHRGRQLSISSSCTDVSERSMTPELERSFPNRSNVMYLRVRRAHDAHFVVIVLPTTTSTALEQSQTRPQRNTKVILGAELHRMLSRPPKFPAGTVIYPYRVIPLTGPNALHLRRASASSATSEESS
ncbi:hypothetical protein EUX98_g1243 [Antrodiella citrinella]|uniref:Uncharacterized protein n=1 Tax=Antrodiella citrinella TaxID=2447956 RepID=A0A4S4N1V8_9APHY|nr:hypothetical protein EUX98_g1243 [Antrodiella citrinella]